MIWKKLMGEFVDVIEWTDSSSDTLVYRFERQGNEIKFGAKLTVRESQVAVFINEGKLADVFEPGMYELKTQNLPILSTLQAWKHGFSSPFKAEVYFINKKQFTGLKWGTKNPIMLRDPEFGPVRVRAFGTFAIRVGDPVALLKEVVGTDGHFTTGEIMEQLRDMLVSRFSSSLGEAKIPVLDMAANYDDVGDVLIGRMKPEFAAYGIELTKVVVENVSLPPEVEAVMDKRTSMGIVGDLSKYATFQAAEAMGKAAGQPGSGAGEVMGAAMGMAMAQQMAGAMGQGQRAGTATPPPLPGGAKSYFIAVGGQQTGPFDLAQLKDQALGGKLTRDSLVWAEGMAAWTKAGEVGELAGLFATVPPPLPPA